MNRLIVVMALLAGCSDPGPTADCKQFEAAVDSTLRVAAYEIAKGISDNSAIRDTVREVRTSNHLSHIGIQLQLMAQNRCPPIKESISVDMYLPQAGQCFEALAKWKSGDPYPLPICDVANWKRPVKKS